MNTRNVRCVLITLFCLLFSACSNSTKENDEHSNKESEAQNTRSVEDNSTSSLNEHTETTERDLEKVLAQEERPIFKMINGIKMRLEQPKLTIGAKVFDTSTGAYAVVTGAIVVVLDGAELSQETWLSEFSVKKLANKTFELRVYDKQSDLYEVYTRLRKEHRFKNIELSLHYAGIDSADTH